MSKLYYRPEIDGLRAVAVLSVLLFHAKFEFIPGGFMGVDIFFVLSGFLITSIILKGLNNNSFSFIDFWERRARRILPASFVVVLCTLIAAYIIFLPSDLIQLGKEMASQSLFGSNFLFAKQGGYFDTTNDLKPMLHNWSLAVEEQFYMFFPLGMLIISKFLKNKFALILWLGFFMSLALCLYYVEISQRFAFYLLPFRSWELIAGALVAVHFPTKPFPKVMKESLSLFGISLIFIALVFYKETMLFPSYIALLPVIGTSLVLISSKTTDTFVSKILSFQPIVFIGLISYSLYLWHWPILVFTNYSIYPLYDYTLMMGVGCMALAVALSVLTWAFVEQPIRKKTILSSRSQIMSVSASGLFLMALIGGALIYTKGLPDRYDAQILKYSESVNDINPYRENCDKPSISNINSSDVCQTNKDAGKPTFALWGDSHADAIAPAFFNLSNKYNKNGYLLTSSGCPPILSVENNDPVYEYNCSEQNNAFLNLLIRENIKKVYIVSSWKVLSNKFDEIESTTEYPGYSEFYPNLKFAALAKTLDTLKEAAIDIYILQNVPTAKKEPPIMLALQEKYNIENKYAIDIEDYENDLNNGIGAFQEIYKGDGIHYIDPRPLLCNDEVCHTELDGGSLYYNKSHISAYGAELLEPLFERSFQE